MSDSPRYGTNSSNTSKYMTDLLNEFIKMPKGVFNLNRRKIQDCTPYAIHPIESWEMLPNSDVYLKYDVQMLSKSPTVKRMLSGMNAEIRVYKCNYNDCWEGWNNFITKGRSGKVDKSIPYVDLSLGSNDVTTSLPYNPMESMRHAPTVFLAKNGSAGSGHEADRWSFDYNVGVKAVSNLESSGKTGISTLSGLKASTAMRINALPYVALNKINKAFQNSNLLQNNPHWYPENENHDMILPYSATGAVTTSDYDNPTKAFVSGTSVVEINAVNSGTDDAPVYESYPWLNVLQMSQRKGDYFNTGSPFPDLIRGDIPTLQVINAELTSDAISKLTGTSLSSNIGWENIVKLTQSFNRLYTLGTNTVSSEMNLVLTPDGSTMGQSAYQEYLLSMLNRAGITHDITDPTYKLSDKTVKGIEFSMSQWRYLATMTVLRERLALCDGSYNSMIKTMFGHNPMWHNHDAVYCGGIRQPIVFSEVVNTVEGNDAPLGDVAGRAVSSSNHDVIHVHSDDYGCLIAVLVITPDEYYSQGVDKMWSRLENAEQYLPILNNLSPDATLNKELYVSGDNTTDNDVFNHQERFAYYKSRRNEVSGLLGLAISKIADTGAWVMQRLFSSTPEFNAEFNRGVMTDNEKAVFATTNEAQFNVVIGSNMRFIGPIPEDSRPSDMGISY